jgi:branched-chain amino acid transport system substrate-binding protein
VVFDQYYERGTVDFYPILTKMTPKKPDWLDLAASPTGDQALLMKQVREMGYTGGMSATTQMTPETLVKVAGKSAEGFISAGLDATGPLATKQEKEFEKVYMAKYGPPFNPTSLIFYPPLYIVKQGIEAANSIDSTAVMKKIAEPGWIFDVMGLPTRWGGQDYYGIDRQIFDTVSICELQDGKLRTIKRFSSEEVEKLVKVGK